MKTILMLFGLDIKPFSVYRIAKGDEECRIKREILRGIQKRCKRAVPEEILGSGSFSPE